MSTTPDTPDEPTQRIVIDVDRDGWTQGLQLNIAQLDENGSGHGYRPAGPKYNGSSKNLLRRTLDERDAREIRQYLDAVFPMPPAAKAKEQPCSGGAAIDHDETGVCNHGPTEQTPPVLSDSVRQFLTFALRLAADRMADRGDEFDADDEAALETLRRIAAGTPAEDADLVPYHGEHGYPDGEEPTPAPFTEGRAAFMQIGTTPALQGLRAELRIEGYPPLIGRYAGAGMRRADGHEGLLLIEPMLVFEREQPADEEQGR